jgi:hypothetical protein
MRTRDKIAILLFSLTLGLGALIFWQSSTNDAELRRFRWFAASPMRLMTDEIFTAENARAVVRRAVLGCDDLAWNDIEGDQRRGDTRFRDRLILMEVSRPSGDLAARRGLKENTRATQKKPRLRTGRQLNRIYELENRSGRPTALWTREKSSKR